MKTEVAPPQAWDYNAWLADPERPDPTVWSQEMYGDIYRLDAYPWLAERDKRDYGLPAESIQERRDVYDGPRGPVTRYWCVIGDDVSGLPRKSDLGLYLELLVAAITTGGESGKVVFSYRSLASSIGLKPSSRSYARIDLALLRLKRVHVVCNCKPTLQDQGGVGIEADFCLVGSIGCDAEGKEKIGTLCWNQIVLSPLANLGAVQGAGCGQAGQEITESNTALKGLIRQIISPIGVGPFSV